MDRTVTALTAQKRNPNRINVFLDGEFSFGLSRIVAAWLRIGEELSEEKIARLKEQDTLEVATQRAIELLSYRPRSEAEIRKRLADHGFGVENIEAVLERLRKSGLVSDENFARAWADNRVTFRPRSRRMVAVELRQKGVSEETIDQALNELPEDDDLAYQSGLRYAPRLEGLELEDFRKKMAGFLGRKGFSYGTVAEVTRRIWKEMREKAD
jgi:regulatory protein